MYAISARLGRDGIAGCAVCVLGLVGFLIVRDYPVGTLSEFGPGFVPWVATLGMIALGAVMAVRAVAVGGGERLEIRIGRPLIVVPLGMTIFAFGLSPLGFSLSAALAVFVTSLAAPGTRFTERLLAAIFLSALVTLIFGYGLSMTMPLWPAFLRS